MYTHKYAFMHVPTHTCTHNHNHFNTHCKWKAVLNKELNPNISYSCRRELDVHTCKHGNLTAHIYLPSTISITVQNNLGLVPSVSSCPPRLFWSDWASSQWNRLGLCSSRNRATTIAKHSTDTHFKTELQLMQCIFLGMNVYIPACICSHIWCKACDMAAPVVSSSTDVQAAERPKVWSWRVEREKCIQIIRTSMEMFLKSPLKKTVWQSRCTVAFVDRDAAQIISRKSVYYYLYQVKFILSEHCLSTK